MDNDEPISPQVAAAQRHPSSERRVWTREVPEAALAHHAYSDVEPQAAETYAVTDQEQREPRRHSRRHRHRDNRHTADVPPAPVPQTTAAVTKPDATIAAVPAPTAVVAVPPPPPPPAAAPPAAAAAPPAAAVDVSKTSEPAASKYHSVSVWIALGILAVLVFGAVVFLMYRLRQIAQAQEALQLKMHTMITADTLQAQLIANQRAIQDATRSQLDSVANKLGAHVEETLKLAVKAAVEEATNGPALDGEFTDYNPGFLAATPEETSKLLRMEEEEEPEPEGMHFVYWVRVTLADGSYLYIEWVWPVMFMPYEGNNTVWTPMQVQPRDPDEARKCLHEVTCARVYIPKSGFIPAGYIEEFSKDHAGADTAPQTPSPPSPPAAVSYHNGVTVQELPDDAPSTPTRRLTAGAPAGGSPMQGL